MHVSEGNNTYKKADHLADTIVLLIKSNDMTAENWVQTILEKVRVKMNIPKSSQFSSLPSEPSLASEPAPPKTSAEVTAAPYPREEKARDNILYGVKSEFPLNMNLLRIKFDFSQYGYGIAENNPPQITKAVFGETISDTTEAAGVLYKFIVEHAMKFRASHLIVPYYRYAVDNINAICAQLMRERGIIRAGLVPQFAGPLGMLITTLEQYDAGLLCRLQCHPAIGNHFLPACVSMISRSYNFLMYGGQVLPPTFLYTMYEDYATNYRAKMDDTSRRMMEAAFFLLDSFSK